MSNHSHPIVFVGKTFEDETEALEFIKEKELIAFKEYAEIQEKINNNYCSLEECLNNKFKQFPDSQYLNYVTSRGYFLGYTVAAYKTETDMSGFLEDIKLAKEKWYEIFNEDGVVYIKTQTS